VHAAWEIRAFDKQKRQPILRGGAAAGVLSRQTVEHVVSPRSARRPRHAAVKHHDAQLLERWTRFPSLPGLGQCI
jgi:hypothetical protein